MNTIENMGKNCISTANIAFDSCLMTLIDDIHTEIKEIMKGYSCTAANQITDKYNFY